MCIRDSDMIGRMPGFNKRNDNISHSFASVSYTHLDAATTEEVTEFLETFFKLYPTATEKELAYYVSGNVLEPVNCGYLFRCV